MSKAADLLQRRDARNMDHQLPLWLPEYFVVLTAFALIWSTASPSSLETGVVRKLLVAMAAEGCLSTGVASLNPAILSIVDSWCSSKPRKIALGFASYSCQGPTTSSTVSVAIRII